MSFVVDVIFSARDRSPAEVARRDDTPRIVAIASKADSNTVRFYRDPKKDTPHEKKREEGVTFDSTSGHARTVVPLSKKSGDDSKEKKLMSNENVQF